MSKVLLYCLTWLTGGLTMQPADLSWERIKPTQNGSITIAHVEQVYYFYPTGNLVLRRRNKSVAQAVAQVIAAHGRQQVPATVPDVLLYLFDQPTNNPLTNFEQIWVGYERYEGEFRTGGQLFHHAGPSLTISISAHQQHLSKTLRAIRYGLDQLPQLQTYEQQLARKGVALTEQDLAPFELPLAE